MQQGLAVVVADAVLRGDLEQQALPASPNRSLLPLRTGRGCHQGVRVIHLERMFDAGKPTLALTGFDVPAAGEGGDARDKGGDAKNQPPSELKLQTLSVSGRNEIENMSEM